MSVYYTKLIELLYITREREQSYLKVKLSIEQEIVIYWEIDNDTAHHLAELIEFLGNHKYRLSLHHSWNPIQKQHESYVTKTYMNHSEKLYFSCSEEYVHTLKTIKNADNIGQILAFPFISSKLQEEVVKLEPESEKKPKRKYRHKTLATMVSAMILIFLGSLSYFYFDKTVFGEQAHIKKVDVASTKAMAATKQKEMKVGSYVESSDPIVPYVELTDVETFNLPEGYVALTFDDGPSKYTKQIADVLQEYQVGGTFFFVGYNVKKRPDYVKYVYDNGYTIGSHAMNHVKLNLLSYEEQQRELILAKDLIEGITNEPLVLFRPPYGSYNKKTMDLMEKHEKKMVLWDIDPEDWKGHSPNKIFNHVQNLNASGSIILLHESQEVVDALPKIIEHLQSQNLKIVSLK